MIGFPGDSGSSNTPQQQQQQQTGPIRRYDGSSGPLTLDCTELPTMRLSLPDLLAETHRQRVGRAAEMEAAARYELHRAQEAQSQLQAWGRQMASTARDYWRISVLMEPTLAEIQRLQSVEGDRRACLEEMARLRAVYAQAMAQARRLLGVSRRVSAPLAR